MGMMVSPYRFAAGGGAPDANTLFLCRFTASPPVDEISSATGTLVGNATVDTANSRLTLDGSGDWVTFASSSAFDIGGDFTVEVHTDQAAGQTGGIVGRDPSGAGRWVFYCNGDGTMDFYAENVQAGRIVGTFGAGGLLNGSEHHLAVCRESNTWRAYFDGVQKLSANVSGSVGATSADLFIGTDPFDTTGRDIAGHIGRVKISNVCRYPSGTTFTPPARTDL